MSESTALGTGRSDIMRQVEALVHEVLGDSAVSLREEMLLEDASGWDSLVQTRTIVAIEGRFDVLFDLEELASLSTVAALLDTIERKLRCS